MAKKIAKKIEKKVVKTTKPVKKATKKPTVKSVVKKAVKPVKKVKQVEEEPDFELGGEPIGGTDVADDVELEMNDEDDMLNSDLELPDDEEEEY